MSQLQRVEGPLAQIEYALILDLEVAHLYISLKLPRTE